MAKGDVVTPDQLGLAPKKKVFTPEELGLAPKKEAPPGLLSSAVGYGQDLAQAGLQKVGEITAPIMEPYEKYVAGPIRAGASEALDFAQEHPMLTAAGGAIPANLYGAGKNLYSQFTEQPQQAPTGKELLAKVPGAGLLSEKPASETFPGLYSETGEGAKLQKGGILDVSPKGVAGGLVEAGLDPTSYIGGGAASKAAKGAGVAEKATGLTKAAAKKVVDKGVKIESKLASALTGVEPHLIETYIKENKSVNDLINKYGKNSTEAADAIRTQYQTQLRTAKNELNKKITDSLMSKGSEVVSIKDILDDLDKQSSKLNKVTKKSEIAEVNELKEAIKQLTDESGDVLLTDLHDLKEFAQDRAKGAYQKGGQIFMPGKDSQRISKQTAALLRKKLNSAAPDIAQANNKLAMLHGAEENLNRNLIKPGAPEGALMTAGAKPESRQAQQLKRLSNVAGTEFQNKAEQLAAAREFASPELLPKDPTGKSATRLAAGAGLGLIKGGPLGAAIGAAATSPALLKFGLNTQEQITKVAKYMGKPVEWVLDPKNAKMVEAGLYAAGPQVLQTSQKQR